MPSSTQLTMLVTLLVAGASAAPTKSLFELSVVHLNDFHARFQEAALAGGACPKGKEDTCVGGMARVAAVAKSLLAERPNALLLNAGDNFQGTLWYSLYRWNVTASILNLLPWDAIGLGNHEFDRKLAGVIPFIQALKAPVLVANMDDSREPSFQGLTKPSVVVERGGRKIGIIGLITNTTMQSSYPENLNFTGEMLAAGREAARLKEGGVDIIVVLSHIGIQMDQEIAASDPNVDLVVGGHSHTLLYTGTAPGGETPYGVYPIVVKQPSGRKVAVVQAGAFTAYLGNLTAFFDSDGELVSAVGNPILLDKSIEPDAAMAAALEPWQAGLSKLAERRVGSSAVFLKWGDYACSRAECDLGSVAADALALTQVGKGGPGSWTRAAIALFETGGLRAAIAVGDLTYNDVVTVLPFGNTIDTLEVRGAALRQELERSISSPSTRTSGGSTFTVYFGFLQVSGLRVTYDPSKEIGSRVVSVLALCHACDDRKYEPLKDDEWYPIAMNSYLASGGDNHTLFRDESRNHEIGDADVDVMMEYLMVHDPIQARDDQGKRIVFVSAESAENAASGKMASRLVLVLCVVWLWR